MSVSFYSVADFPGWRNNVKHQGFFDSIVSGYSPQSILELGSGADPTLTPEYVLDSGAYYVTSDADARELEKADAAFERLVLDAMTDVAELSGKFDCILSRMVGEHIKDGEQYHRNIYEMLKPGGISVHCFSTLGALPFVANRVLPGPVSDLLLHRYAPREGHTAGKFKAYYSWSRGPSRSMLRRFEGLGFEVISYTGYFGHNYYRSIPWLHRLEMMKADLLLKHPIPQLCSYSTVVLRKP